MSIHVVESDVEPGATILDVVPDSPADRAGLRAGDVVVAVDGQELDAENDLAGLVAAHEPGDSVTLEIEEPGEGPRQVTVELGEHPDEEGTAYLGVRYRPARHVRVLEGPGFSFGERRRGPFPLPHGEGEFFLPHVDLEGLDGEIVQGAVVEDVREDSPAEQAGLRQGDLITAIEGDPVKGPADLADAIAGREPGDRVTLTILRLDGDEHEEREIEVTLAEHPDEEGVAYLGLRVGGFVHIQRFAGDGERPDLDLFIDPQMQFDGPGHFEFRFSPGHRDCCGQSI
jgi:PDZ domain-containing secreted protein